VEEEIAQRLAAVIRQRVLAEVNSDEFKRQMQQAIETEKKRLLQR
jgi:hypothetical protein